jgi:hypothetical protein
MKHDFIFKEIYKQTFLDEQAYLAKICGLSRDFQG